MVGKIISVNINSSNSMVKEPIEKALFKVNHGMVGDGHAGVELRQVSLLSWEMISCFQEFYGQELICGSFLENLTVEGLDFEQLPVGALLAIGETQQIISQKGNNLCRYCLNFQKPWCIMPKEGIFTKVIRGGTIKKGDLVEILSLVN